MAIRSAHNDQEQAQGRRLIMVPDRLPVSLELDENDEWRTQPVSGGLATALEPIMQRHGGVWVGWSGVASTDESGLRDALDRQYNDRSNYRLAPVVLSDEQVHGFYKGFANEIIWPLFHNQFTACNFEPEYWRIYQQVNHEFARCVARQAEADDFIWVHDYHLMTLGQELRANGVSTRCGFSLHIPFPTLDIFSNLPWWREFLSALLAYDFIGFQTEADQSNFLDCVANLYSEIKTCIIDDDRTILEVADPVFGSGHRRLGVGTLPISVDYDSVSKTAASEQTEVFVQHYCNSWRASTIMLGVDHLDYSKGLPQKLKAFRHALRQYPELRGRICLDQYVLPSCEQIPRYTDLKAEIDRLVGEINGEFTQSEWIPIHYNFHSLKPEKLIAYYRAADIALITPLKDGMNLAAKEYCAARIDDTGVLILSEFAGAAAELGDYALLVNPHDIAGVAARIHEAYGMALDERRRRMRAMRAIVRENDASEWVRRFLDAACADDPA